MSDRLEKIVEGFDLRPGSEVLEIGCGHGVAATFVCERIPDGHYLAVDRSRKMIEAASRRNAAFVESGRAEFLVGEADSIDLGERMFDLIFAVRVGLFHRQPGLAESLFSRHLSPGGRIETFYDGPPGRTT